MVAAEPTDGSLDELLDRTAEWLMVGENGRSFPVNRSEIEVVEEAGKTLLGVIGEGGFSSRRIVSFGTGDGEIQVTVAAAFGGDEETIRLVPRVSAAELAANVELARLEKANEIAEALKSQLEDGKAVDELRIPGAGDGARSPGQDLGFVTLSDLRSEITAAVKDLDAGQVSDVVEFAAAKYVFRIAAKADSEGAVDEVTREKIRTQIFQTKFEERLRLFFDEELPKKYQVELIAAKAK